MNQWGEGTAALVERLRTPIPPEFDGEYLVSNNAERREAADRIEQLEAALRKILSHPTMFDVYGLQEIAREALRE